MKRNIFTLILSLATLPILAHDFEAVNDDGVTIYYSITSSTNKTVAVSFRGSSYSSFSNEYSGSVYIPLSVNYYGTTYSVTSIGNRAFSGCTGLTSVTIPNSITSIGEYAFSDCAGATSFSIPNSVSIIGISAFSGTGLYNNESNWEQGVLYISDCLIKVKSNKISGKYDIKQDTRIIANSAFSSCSALKSVTIPNSVTHMGSSTFWGCTGLTQVEIPNSVNSIGNWAFYNCSSLTSVTIPSSVSTIGEYAFSLCKHLTSFTIPTSVTSIGSAAFFGTGIYNNESNWEQGVLYISDCIVGAENNTISHNYNIKEGTRLIADHAFEFCNNLTAVTIPDSVTHIGDFAFYLCSNLATVIFGNCVTAIGEAAFHQCSSLTSVTIPDSVTSIGSAAFQECSSLTSVTIPSSVTSIGEYAFFCSHLNEIYSKSTTPTDIKLGSFVFYAVPKNTCTLYVPIGSCEKYQSVYQWNDFENIVETNFSVPGDANEDGIIDASDIAYMVDFMLGIEYGKFNEAAADLNGDGKVNASDISAIILLILDN